MRNFSLAFATAAAALTFQSVSFAADAPARGMRAPAAAAIAACQGKAEGAPVTWTGRAGKERTGQCTMVGNTLAARMVRGPGKSASAPSK